MATEPLLKKRSRQIALQERTLLEKTLLEKTLLEKTLLEKTLLEKTLGIVRSLKTLFTGR